MSEEIQLEGLGVAPGVLETIAALSAQSVEGVVGIPGAQGFAGLVQKGGAKGVQVCVGEDSSLQVVLHLVVAYGNPLRDVASSVQRAVSDALLTQTGQSVQAVDVFIDDIEFPAL